MTLADQIAAQLVQEFLDEAGDRLARVQLALNALSGKPADRKGQLLDLSREIHTIKGNGKASGFAAISQVAHRFEDYLALVVEKPALPVAELQRFADAMVELVEQGRDPGPDGTAAILRALPVHSQFDPDSVVARPGRALVVTRARTIGHMLARELANCGFRSQTENDPFEALRYATTDRPDVVLSSAVLGGLSGIDLLTALRAMRETRALTVAVVTSFGSGHAELADLPADIPVVRLGETLADDLAQVLTRAADGP